MAPICTGTFLRPFLLGGSAPPPPPPPSPRALALFRSSGLPGTVDILAELQDLKAVVAELNMTVERQSGMITTQTAMWAMLGQQVQTIRGYTALAEEQAVTIATLRDELAQVNATAVAAAEAIDDRIAAAAAAIALSAQAALGAGVVDSDIDGT